MIGSLEIAQARVLAARAAAQPAPAATGAEALPDDSGLRLERDAERQGHRHSTSMLRSTDY